MRIYADIFGLYTDYNRIFDPFSNEYSWKLYSYLNVMPTISYFMTTGYFKKCNFSLPTAFNPWHNSRLPAIYYDFKE